MACKSLVFGNFTLSISADVLTSFRNAHCQ